jgi:hypothetical protein
VVHCQEVEDRLRLSRGSLGGGGHHRRAAPFCNVGALMVQGVTLLVWARFYHRAATLLGETREAFACPQGFEVHIVCPTHLVRTEGFTERWYGLGGGPCGCSAGITRVSILRLWREMALVNPSNRGCGSLLFRIRLESSQIAYLSSPEVCTV